MFKYIFLLLLLGACSYNPNIGPKLLGDNGANEVRIFGYIRP